jgi:ABC-type multidrug transport system permease subunit
MPLMLIALVMGRVVSSSARSEFQAVAFVPPMFLSKILMTEVILTLDGFPLVFRWFTQTLPNTHANPVTRNLLLMRQPLAGSWLHLHALAGLLLAAFACLASEGRT